MEIQFKLDTSQPSDVAQLAALCAALGGAAPAPVKRTTPAKVDEKPEGLPKPEKPAPTANALPATNGAPAQKEYTIAEIRNMLSTKDKAGAKAALAQVSETGKLADVPAEKFNELVALLKNVPEA